MAAVVAVEQWQRGSVSRSSDSGI
eukprot:COSAG06_NODE_65789_length_256_cov_0.649682_1_plen_23_part_01